MARLCLCQHQLSKHAHGGGHARGGAHVHPLTSPLVHLNSHWVVGCASDFQCLNYVVRTKRRKKKLGRGSIFPQECYYIVIINTASTAFFLVVTTEGNKLPRGVANIHLYILLFLFFFRFFFFLDHLTLTLQQVFCALAASSSAETWVLPTPIRSKKVAVSDDAACSVCYVVILSLFDGCQNFQVRPVRTQNDDMHKEMHESE